MRSATAGNLNDNRSAEGGSGPALLALLSGRRFVALTGAGCSTESGIPDYRGAGRTGPRNPIQHDDFVRRAAVRRRYWARATLGWERFSVARPNSAHQALAALEARGLVTGIITQNVDRLHQQAGSRRVVELHGALAEVGCLACGRRESRSEVHDRLVHSNPRWLEQTRPARPDGDTDLDDAAVDAFQLVGCRSCGGDLKPEVVFFGGTVPEPTIEAARAMLDEAQALLVVGSSLAVYSGFRFVRWASEAGLPIGIVNLGPTRGDDLAQARVSAPAGATLTRLAQDLSAASA